PNPDRSDLSWIYDERQRKQLFVTRSKRLLHEIDAALQRIEDGVYGICTKCGQAICFERLEAIPTAALCIKCQQHKE
ncbi:MAG: TraR/DksA C4-type zinc finger protein, partial [Chloroflexi bacterium]|nr:TraR/DksA C4-type zinc finger protein [Chloroflexota bacterium]